MTPDFKYGRPEKRQAYLKLSRVVRSKHIQQLSKILGHFGDIQLLVKDQERILLNQSLNSSNISADLLLILIMASIASDCFGMIPLPFVILA